MTTTGDEKIKKIGDATCKDVHLNSKGKLSSSILDVYTLSKVNNDTKPDSINKTIYFAVYDTIFNSADKNGVKIELKDLVIYCIGIKIYTNMQNLDTTNKRFINVNDIIYFNLFKTISKFDGYVNYNELINETKNFNIYCKVSPLEMFSEDGTSTTLPCYELVSYYNNIANVPKQFILRKKISKNIKEKIPEDIKKNIKLCLETIKNILDINTQHILSLSSVNNEN